MIDSIQKAAVKKLSQLKAGALFMHMGTGKTKAAFDLAKAKIGRFDAIAWIAPASLLNDQRYQRELSLRNDCFDLFTFSIEGVSQSDAAFLELNALADKKKVFCIIDESLTIKNSLAKRTQRLLTIAQKFAYRLILNGTPISKGLYDVWAQMEFLHPKILNMTERQFANSFLIYRFDGSRPWIRWSKPANEAALVEMIRPYIFDAKLDMGIELDSQTVNTPLTGAEASAYSNFKNDFLGRCSDAGFLQVANAFQSAYTVCQSKLEWVRTQSEPTIWFVKFLHEINTLEQILDSPLVYCGRKKDVLDDASRHVIMTYGTGAKGLNLQEWSHLVFFSDTFDYAAKIHGEHRIVRTGQNRKCFIRKLKVNTGLDDLMRRSIDKKSNTANEVGRLLEQGRIEAL